MRNKIKFPIGDWSEDGHGKCRWFLVSTALTLNDVREAHFKCKDVLGFDIGDLCSRYGECYLKDNIIEIISDKIWDKHLRLDAAEIDELKERIKTDFYDEDLLDIWLDILNYINPSLILIKDDEEDYPSINFYGVDEQRRHLKTPGYGLFD